MIDPALSWLIGGALALLFLGAALHKLRDLAAFRALVEAYALLPPGLHVAGLLIPWLELLVGAGLLLPGARRAAALGGCALLVLYALALATNIARGRRDLSCGCGGFAAEAPIATWMVLRNLLLATLLALSATVAPRRLEAVDALSIGAGVLIATLLYMSIDRLLGQVRLRALALRGPE
ncbi:MAG: methylamine utilization protein MauE [Gammaproteobacteria bacterium]|nr:methylamine utilization protein MauE [Gammaproteobacteria bacterium]MBV9697257.1 methylamine utilization protein MauE [Gammaproteobacteria bacterium]